MTSPPNRRRSRATPGAGIWFASAVLALGAAAAAQTITGTGILPSWNLSVAECISADGQTICGASYSGSLGRAFRWHVGTLQDLGVLPGLPSSGAYGVSGDGAVVVGVSVDQFGVGSPFRWTAASGIQEIGALPPDSNAAAISRDATSIVGTTRVSNVRLAYRLSQAGGLQTLGLLPGSTRSDARAVNADGSVVVGDCISPGAIRAFRWTGAAGMQSLGEVPGANQISARAVSADGATIAGSLGSSASNSYRAFLWTPSGGFEVLGALQGAQSAGALAMNADATLLVGECDNKATLWTRELGTVDLNVYLPSIGLNLTGWSLFSARGVSADGLTITGRGAYNGIGQGFIVRLPSPECYANCDGSTTPPVLNVADFSCFLTKFAAGAGYANCDGSTTEPVLDVADFSCFLTKFAAGCP